MVVVFPPDQPDGTAAAGAGVPEADPADAQAQRAEVPIDDGDP